jgi:hypothetical protein
LVERVLGKDEVTSSILVIGSTSFAGTRSAFSGSFLGFQLTSRF